MSNNDNLSRRSFHKLISQLSVGAFVGISRREAWSVELSQDKNLPNISCGVASGDILADSATLWSRSDRASRMVVDIATREDFQGARRVVGPDTFEHHDFTSKLRISGLKPGEHYFYRLQFQDLDDRHRASMPLLGQFKTPSSEPRTIRFAWSGDTAGQGYGIDLARGGMKTFETLRSKAPDFFVNSGDVCYADNPILSEVKLDDGSVWKNVVTEGKSKVAESLEEYRANYRYNLLDENVRRMNAQIPMYVQWDDHEVLNNWYPGEILDDNRYKEKRVSMLAARARQAYFDYLPIRATSDGHSRIYRAVPYGPLLELFFLDVRSYRGPNTTNRQAEASDVTAFMGREQLAWLKRRLKASQATWKVICCDMPIGLIVRDGRTDFEAAANGNGPPLGRELEFAELLRFMKQNQIRNTIWLTADVHYAASHYFNPERAVFQEFDPFWEFISGPMHAGTFGPGELDNTFGPELKFKSIPNGMKGNRPPSEGFQFFGLVQIDGASKVLTVEHYDTAGTKLWSVDLQPVA